MRIDYQTEPVFTNALGEPRVCHPDRVPEKTGEFFTHRDGGRVEAKIGSGGRTGHHTASTTS